MDAICLELKKETKDFMILRVWPTPIESAVSGIWLLRALGLQTQLVQLRQNWGPRWATYSRFIINAIDNSTQDRQASGASTRDTATPIGEAGSIRSG